MSDVPETPESFWQALQDRAREVAEENGTSPSEEIQNHVYDRLMARVFTSGAQGWMVDGGRSLVLRYPGSRTTTDLDMSTSAATVPDQAVAEIVRAAESDLGDFVRFELDATTKFTTPPGAQIDFDVTCGGKRIDGISIDVVMSPPLTAEPDTVPLPKPLVSVATETADPDVRVRPLLEQMANKIGGLFIHWDGLPPTRAKDLVDILLMSANENFSGRELHKATHDEFARIVARGNTLRVPTRFKVPDPSWEQRYAKAVTRVPGCPQRTLDEALPMARRFLDPLLRPEAPNADWDHRSGRWIDPSEGERRSVARTAEWTSGTDMIAIEMPAGQGPFEGSTAKPEESKASRLLRPTHGPAAEERSRRSLG